MMRKIHSTTGPDIRGGGKLAVAQRPPQLRGLHKKHYKNYYLRKHKKYFFETANLE